MMNVNAKIIKIIFLCLFVFAGAVSTNGVLYGQELLKTLFIEKKWDRLADNFSDSSHNTLKNYFTTSKSVIIITAEPNKMTYKAKFPQQGEIGVITFEKKNSKYFNLKIKNQIRPLYFIEKFKKYRADNIKLVLGDAEVQFISGYFYETMPFHSLLLFDGIWKFSIKPSDREEQLTLKRKFKRDSFSRSAQTGIFILHQREFLDDLPSQGEITELPAPGIQSIFTMYRETYGIHIPQFNEYWYLPFPDETNLAIFKRDKQSFFYYSFNQNQVPDTRLSESGSNDIILSYNAHKGLKLRFGASETLSHFKLSLFFNPKNYFISGTASISYKRPSSLRILELADGLRLLGNLNVDARGLNIFRKRGKYYLMGPESQDLALYFNGRITPGPDNFEIFKSAPATSQTRPVIGQESAQSFYFLSKNQNYYPNPGNEFVKTDITLTLPGQLNCLASGSRVSVRKIEDSAVYKFSSPGTKGVSLAVGKFKRVTSLKGRHTLHIYRPNSLKIPKNLDLEEIKNAADFYIDAFGPLDLKEINILLKQGAREGGVSNNGFIVVNLPLDKIRLSPQISLTTPLTGDKPVISPVLIRNRSEDHILHELAHQWWGGAISWDSYHEAWLTEGLAHFSILYYLKKQLPEKRFLRLVKKLKRWVYKFSDTGPVIYGTRINMLEKDYDAYQSVIYNKGAMIFLMLLDLIGEEEFNRRIGSVLTKFKYKNVSSTQFIRQFSGKDPMISAFFKRWVYSRIIPLVELKLAKEDKENDTESFKRVVLTIEQLNIDGDEPFIFPLKLEVITQKGASIEPVIMKEIKQRFVITRDSAIRSIEIIDHISLIKERKQSRFKSAKFKVKN